MPDPGSQPPVDRPPLLQPPRLQFSLRWLLIGVTAIALAIGLFAVGGVARIAMGLIMAVLLRGVVPTVFAVGAMYGRGDLRAFAIGGFVANIPLLTNEIGPIGVGGIMMAFVSQAIVIGICGASAVATRRWIARRQYPGD